MKYCWLAVQGLNLRAKNKEKKRNNSNSAVLGNLVKPMGSDSKHYV